MKCSFRWVLLLYHAAGWIMQEIVLRRWPYLRYVVKFMKICAALACWTEFEQESAEVLVLHP